MSNDFSWTPGMAMAVTHLVCVFAGAPGPVQGAATAMLGVTSNTTANNAGASAPERYVSNLDFFDMNSSVTGVSDLDLRRAHSSIRVGWPGQGTLLLVRLVVLELGRPQIRFLPFWPLRASTRLYATEPFHGISPLRKRPSGL